MQEDVRCIETMFKALAYEKRMRILDYIIRNPEKTVSEISDSLRLPLTTVSRSLMVLANADLLLSRRYNTHVHYRVKTDGPFGHNVFLLAMVKHAFEREMKKSTAGEKNLLGIWLSGNYKAIIGYLENH